VEVEKGGTRYALYLSACLPTRYLPTYLLASTYATQVLTYHAPLDHLLPN